MVGQNGVPEEPSWAGVGSENPKKKRRVGDLPVCLLAKPGTAIFHHERACPLAARRERGRQAIRSVGPGSN